MLEDLHAAAHRMEAHQALQGIEAYRHVPRKRTRRLLAALGSLRGLARRLRATTGDADPAMQTSAPASTAYQGGPRAGAVGFTRHLAGGAR